MTKARRTAWFLVVFFLASGTLSVQRLSIWSSDCVVAGYEQRSAIPFVNEYFARQPPQLLSYYKRVAQTQSQLLSILWISGGVLFALAINPDCQRWLQNRGHSPRGTKAWKRLKTLRAVSIFVLILGALGMSVLSMLSGIEAWPFSPYIMFSNSHAPHSPFKVYRLYAVHRNQETRLTQHNFGYKRITRIIPDFSNWHTQKDFRRIQAGLDGWLRSFPDDVFPEPISSLRLYLAQWPLICHGLAAATILLEIAVPFALFNRWAKRIPIPSTYATHLAIWLLVGPWFLNMIRCCLVGPNWKQVFASARRKLPKHQL